MITRDKIFVEMVGEDESSGIQTWVASVKLVVEGTVSDCVARSPQSMDRVKDQLREKLFRNIYGEVRREFFISQAKGRQFFLQHANPAIFTPKMMAEMNALFEPLERLLR